MKTTNINYSFVGKQNIPWNHGCVYVTFAPRDVKISDVIFVSIAEVVKVMAPWIYFRREAHVTRGTYQQMFSGSNVQGGIYR